MIFLTTVVMNSCGTNTTTKENTVTAAIPEPQKLNKVLWYKGMAANPLLIYTFIPQSGERPVIVSYNFVGGHNRFFIEHPIDSTTADLADSTGRFSYTLLGQTDNKIYVVQTALAKGSYVSKALLFFSIRDHVMGMNADTPHIEPLITLEKFYKLGNKQDAQVTVSGNKVIIDIPSAEKKHIEVSTDNDNTAAVIEDNSYPPAGLKGSTVERDWREADSLFYFHRSPISPYLLDELNGGLFFLSDGPDTRVVDMEAGSVSRKYENNLDDKRTGFTSTCMSYGTEYHTYFSYDYLGKTSNGVHVVRTVFSGGGSGVFGLIQFIRFRVRRGFDCNGILKDQLLMCLERYDSERDRTQSIINIKGNTVTMDIPERPTPVDEATDTTHIVEKF
jgi:hypothetical protein